MSVLLGRGDGTFAPPMGHATAGYPDSVSIADLDGDGLDDVVVASHSGVSVLLGHGDGTFAAKVDYASPSTPVSVAIGDLNRDGRLDLAVANLGDNLTADDPVPTPSTVSVLLGSCR